MKPKPTQVCVFLKALLLIVVCLGVMHSPPALAGLGHWPLCHLHPIGVNLRYYNELTVTNRPNGQSTWDTLTFGF